MILPTALGALKTTLLQDFVAAEIFKWSRNWLRKLKQRKSVSKYLSEFRSLVFTIPNMHYKENIDRFKGGLEFNARVEFVKSHADSFDEFASTALSDDSATWKAGGPAGWERSPKPPEQSARPMKMRNVEDVQCVEKSWSRYTKLLD